MAFSQRNVQRFSYLFVPAPLTGQAAVFLDHVWICIAQSAVTFVLVPPGSPHGAVCSAFGFCLRFQNILNIGILTGSA